MADETEDSAAVCRAIAARGNHVRADLIADIDDLRQSDEPSSADGLLSLQQLLANLEKLIGLSAGQRGGGLARDEH